MAAEAYGVGDNKEFSVATIGEITVYFFNSSGKTATDDDPNNRVYYFSNPRTVKRYIIRYDQTIAINQVGSLQNITLTDPITCAIGDGTIEPATGAYKERYESPTVSYLKINILTENTNLKIRIL